MEGKNLYHEASNLTRIRRLQAIEQLPKRDQEALLRTIDAFIAKG